MDRSRASYQTFVSFASFARNHSGKMSREGGEGYEEGIRTSGLRRRTKKDNVADGPVNRRWCFRWRWRSMPGVPRRVAYCRVREGARPDSVQTSERRNPETV